jgi:hypothetical protein
MKHVVEMGSVAMICIPSFIKIGSAIQKLIWGDIQTHREDGDRLSLLLCIITTVVYKGCVGGIHIHIS